jgi:hypothetical protein
MVRRLHRDLNQCVSRLAFGYSSYSAWSIKTKPNENKISYGYPHLDARGFRAKQFSLASGTRRAFDDNANRVSRTVKLHTRARQRAVMAIGVLPEGVFLPAYRPWFQAVLRNPERTFHKIVGVALLVLLEPIASVQHRIATRDLL